MSESQFQFRTATFGGFQKQDVLTYLEASAREHAERLDALRRELEELRKDREQAEAQKVNLETQVNTLMEENRRLAADLAQREAVLAESVSRGEALEIEVVELRARMEKLAPAATAYEAIKDRTAGIELEAHSRAQAIEGEAHRKARRVTTQVGEWFDKLESSYGRLRTDLDATLSHAARELERVEQSLREISGELDGHEEALKALRAQGEVLTAPKPAAPGGEKG